MQAHCIGLLFDEILTRTLTRALTSALAYRNVLTRYELLLNRFLRDKTAIRGDEVRRFARREARRQRARRAAALLAWLRGEEGPPLEPPPPPPPPPPPTETAAATAAPAMEPATEPATAPAEGQPATTGPVIAALVPTPDEAVAEATRAAARPPLAADELVRAAEGAIGGRFASGVELAPALRDLQRLGLVRQAAGHPPGVLEVAPDGERRLREYWSGLLLDQAPS